LQLKRGGFWRDNRLQRAKVNVKSIDRLSGCPRKTFLACGKKAAMALAALGKHGGGKKRAAPCGLSFRTTGVA